MKRTNGRDVLHNQHLAFVEDSRGAWPDDVTIPANRRVTFRAGIRIGTLESSAEND